MAYMESCKEQHRQKLIKHNTALLLGVVALLLVAYIAQQLFLYLPPVNQMTSTPLGQILLNAFLQSVLTVLAGVLIGFVSLSCIRLLGLFNEDPNRN